MGCQKRWLSGLQGRGTIRARVERVGRIHQDLIAGYQRDFGKYAGKLHAQHIEQVFASVPRQLAACQDDSVRRFRFRDAVERKRRYQELRGPIDWLETAKLVRKCYPLKGRGPQPRCGRRRGRTCSSSTYLMWVAWLHAWSDLCDQRAQSLSFKGYMRKTSSRTN